MADSKYPHSLTVNIWTRYETMLKAAFIKLVSRSSMVYASMLVVGLIIIGTLGYKTLEGWSFLDALYATIITLTTVGYGDLSPQSMGGRLFAIFFTLTAIGIAGYALSTVAAYVFDREHDRVRRIIRERKMRQIGKLS